MKPTRGIGQGCPCSPRSPGQISGQECQGLTVLLSDTDYVGAPLPLCPMRPAVACEAGSLLLATDEIQHMGICPHPPSLIMEKIQFLSDMLKQCLEPELCAFCFKYEHSHSDNTSHSHRCRHRLSVTVTVTCTYHTVYSAQCTQ